MKESSNRWNQSKASHQHEISNYSLSSNNDSNHTGDSSSGISAILSPRNLFKFITKNIQQIASPRLAAIMSNNVPQVRYISNITQQQVTKQFGRYIQITKLQMQRYKAICLKKTYLQSQKGNKQSERQQLQEQIKISKIPQQYFQQWRENDKQQQGQQIKKIQSIQDTSSSQSHKSMKLYTLLMIDNQKEKKKTREKRRPLYSKQLQLEGLLDQIQIVIFNKTKKYPDRYLNYLASLNNSDLQVGSILKQISKIRSVINKQLYNVRSKQLKVVKLESRKKSLIELIEVMKLMRLLKNFKSQSTNNKQPQIKENLQDKSNADRVLKNSELIRNLHQHPKIEILYKIQSVSSTINNAQQIIRAVKTKRLQKICKILHKDLSNKLNNMYSRDTWLKSQLPKDSLMIQRMKQQIQKSLQKQTTQQSNLNNSYLNISVLDQSYCVSSNPNSNKKQSEVLSFGNHSRQITQIMQQWQDYQDEYMSKIKKKEQQQEHIFQVFQRVVFKFTVNFKSDLQDYIIYIFNQKFSNIKMFPTHKERIIYIRPKLFNKITKVYFQALSTSLTYSLIFKSLSSTHSKLLGIIQQKIKEIIDMRSMTQYSLVQNHLLNYQDVSQILSSLDYWFEYAQQLSDKFQSSQQYSQLNSAAQCLMQFQQNIMNKKNKTIQDYLSNLHKFALTSDLKTVIQKSDYSSISIPIHSFSILDFIINWGQSEQTKQHNNNLHTNQVEQSFNYGSSFLVDLQNQKRWGIHSKKFSIFKVIDKKLIIQGKQYRLCHSTVFLFQYLSVYLRAKQDFPQLLTTIDERVCQLIGFYIWYCKKIIFTTQNSHKTQNQQSGTSQNTKVVHSTKTNQFINKKTIGNLCMLINLCDLLTKLMDILNISSKPKKVQKVLLDLQTIKSDSIKQITMIPFLQVQQQISVLYQSRLKTRKQIPTKQSLNIISIIQRNRTSLQQHYADKTKEGIKKILQNTIKIISKNYFGYLLNMQARGKAELKWFLPNFKEIIGDLFAEQIFNLQKQAKH